MKGMTAFLKAYGGTLAREKEAGKEPRKFQPPVVISREIGSGGRLIAEALAQKLGFEVLSRRIVEEIANHTKVPEDLVELLDERPGRSLEVFGAGLLRGASINSGDYEQVLKSTVTAFLELGNVVLVGRGGVFLAKPGRALRILVFAPLSKRIARYAEYRKLDEKHARAEVLAIDADRLRFHKVHFRHSEVTPEFYDLSINTGELGIEASVDISLAAYEHIRQAVHAAT
jgi:cytidylate kinase